MTSNNAIHILQAVIFVTISVAQYFATRAIAATNKRIDILMAHLDCPVCTGKPSSEK